MKRTFFLLMVAELFCGCFPNLDNKPVDTKNDPIEPDAFFNVLSIDGNNVTILDYSTGVRIVYDMGDDDTLEFTNSKSNPQIERKIFHYYKQKGSYTIWAKAYSETGYYDYKCETIEIK